MERGGAGDKFREKDELEPIRCCAHAVRRCAMSVVCCSAACKMQVDLQPPGICIQASRFHEASLERLWPATSRPPAMDIVLHLADMLFILSKRVALASSIFTVPQTGMASTATTVTSCFNQVRVCCVPLKLL